MSPADKGEDPASPHMIKIAQPFSNSETLDDIKAILRQPVIWEKLNPEPTPVAEETAEKILSLSMHPALTDQDLENIVASVEKTVACFHRG